MENCIKKDLKSIYKNNYIEAVRHLNKQLGHAHFHDNIPPMYFTGNVKAKQ